MRMDARIVVLVAMTVVCAPSTTSADSLSVELEIPLSSYMAWAQDLAVDSSGYMYVLGRNAADTSYGVFKFAPNGSLEAILGTQVLYAPGRLAITDSGRLVVSEICYQPETECRAAAYVFAPDGTLERTVLMPAGIIVQLASLGGETVAAGSHYLDETFHFDLRILDAATGAIESDFTGFVSSTGISKLYTQKALDEDNCLRDLYVEDVGGSNHLVVGYSGLNRYRIVDYQGNTIRTIDLDPYTPRSLSTSARQAESEFQDIATAQGRIYNPDTTCGFFSGLSMDDGGNTVVTGRGIVNGEYKSDVYGPTGTQVGTLLSPYELNYTLTFRNGKAFCICNTGSNLWSLIRFARN